jgi:hypothetical protein
MDRIAARMSPGGSLSTRPSNVAKVDRVLADYRRADIALVVKKR